MKNKNQTSLITIVLILLLAMFAAACSPQPTPAPADEKSEEAAQGEAPPASSEPTEAETLILMSHDSFTATPDVIAAFEEANNVKIEFLRSGDAGSALNQAILSKGNPLADVFFGVDNTFLGRALGADIFEPYNAPALADIPDALKLDAENRLLPVDYGDVCLNYDKAWFVDKGLAPPTTLEDLAKADYAGLTVVENPATSSPGLAFLLTTIAHFGPDGYLNYWQQLVDNDVLVVDGWEDAYYGQFTPYEGERPLVVSYASSPPAEVFFAEKELTEAPTGSVTGDETCFRQIEFIGILAGTEKRALAEKFVDFLLSPQFQEDVPLQMFVFPANQNAALPEIFDQYAEIASNPATLPPEDIAANREDWINAWTETVLR